MTNKQGQEDVHTEEEGPPIFKSWRGWYILVLSALVLYIILLYAFSNLY